MKLNYLPRLIALLIGALVALTTAYPVEAAQPAALPDYNKFAAANNVFTLVPPAFAAEYAAKSLPGDITFLVATKTSAPPSPCAMRILIASRATRKCPVAFTANERSQSLSSIRSTGAEWRQRNEEHLR